MDRSISLRLVLFLFLVWGLLTIGFGALVKRGAVDGPHSGGLESTALALASFPETTMAVFSELGDYMSGDYRDESISVPREPRWSYEGLRPIRSQAGVNIDGLMLRGAVENAAPGWRLLSGAFTVDGEVRNAILVISPELEIVSVRVLQEDKNLGETPQAPFRKLIHGVEWLRDGSIVAAFDGGVTLQRVDRCGAPVWMIPGRYNHAVTIGADGESVWTFDTIYSMAQVRISDGEILKRITMNEIIDANPQIDPLELRRSHQNDEGANARGDKGRWLPEPFHMNDIEPLPVHLAEAFPQFEPGDLLLSARSLNLVFVVDPDTLKIKWWRMGSVQRQHDPDWMESGEIMIFNNRMSRDYSEIVTLNPTDFSQRTVYNGADTDFYTRIRGKQQSLPEGGLAISSPQQASVFEVDATGKKVLEFINLKPGHDTQAYVISELKWLPMDALTMETAACLAAN